MKGINLTEIEKEAVKAATLEEWATAIRECTQDPLFWQAIGSSFLEGFVRGLRE